MRPPQNEFAQAEAVGAKRTAAANPKSQIPNPQSQGRRQAPLCFAKRSQVSTTVSGLSDTDSMPSSNSHSARSG